MQPRSLDRFREELARSDDPPPVREAYAAAHVVWRDSYRACGHSLARPGPPEEIAEHVDWDATRAARSHLVANGFGIAEAMDTAQRFFVGWPVAERLIRLTGELAPPRGFLAGAGVDHLESVASREELVGGVVHQARVIQAAGGAPIVLPLAWLVRSGAGADDYVETYDAIFDALDGPLYVHWLGEVFAPELAGYFPGDSFARVMALAPDKVRGAKLSLLDAPFERRVREELAPRGQLVLTGDDFHFDELILEGSHALLGALDGIAEPAGLALRFLARGDTARYRELMEPCVKLARWVFRRPTPHYKAGLAFLAWLNGRQENFLLANREERGHDRRYYEQVTELAAAAGALSDGELARERFGRIDHELSR